MKKLMLIIAMLGLIAIGKVGTVMAQEVPEDSLSIDDMAPVFYEAEDADSGSNATTIVIIVIAIAVVGGGAYYFMKKKK